MKNKLFSIVGNFSLIVGVLALVVAIITGFTASNQFFGSADEDVEHPKIAFNEFYKRNDKKTNEQEAPSDEKSESKEDQEYFKKLTPLTSSISQSFNDFAKTTKQGGVNEDGLEKYLIENTTVMDRENYLVFLESLAESADDLNDKANVVAELKVEDEKYIHWSNDFLPWFIESYMAEYSKELQRIKKEEMEDVVSRASSIVTVGVAISAFLAFVFFTLILLLVQIETNTRKDTN